jgi:hypothetical protein
MPHAFGFDPPEGDSFTVEHIAPVRNAYPEHDARAQRLAKFLRPVYKTKLVEGGVISSDEFNKWSERFYTLPRRGSRSSYQDVIGDIWVADQEPGGYTAYTRVQAGRPLGVTPPIAKINEIITADGALVSSTFQEQAAAVLYLALGDFSYHSALEARVIEGDKDTLEWFDEHGLHLAGTETGRILQGDGGPTVPYHTLGSEQIAVGSFRQALASNYPVITNGSVL